MKEVIVAIKGGVAFLVSATDDIKVVCRDYDVEGCWVNLPKDENGDEYREFELSG